MSLTMSRRMCCNRFVLAKERLNTAKSITFRWFEVIEMPFFLFYRVACKADLSQTISSASLSAIKVEIWTEALAQEVGRCDEHNPLSDKTKIPLWAIIFVYLSRVAFTRFAAPPPPLSPHRPGVISMRINVAINHSVAPLPDVIQGLLKTSALCDVYGRREIWAWQPNPKTLVESPCGTLIQSVSHYCPASSQTESNSVLQRHTEPGLTGSWAPALMDRAHTVPHTYFPSFCLLSFTKFG